MAYRFHVNQTTCINCGICMDLCPVRCLDMTRPAVVNGEGEFGTAVERESPIPGEYAERAWMMLAPVQVADCIGCQVCAQECPTNAITIESAQEVAFAKRGPLTPVPPEGDESWHSLNAYTRATPDEPGETPFGNGHDWRVAERQSVWQTWRTWLGERKEDLRAPCQAACPVGTNAGLYVSLIAQGRYEEALHVASEPNPFPAICGRVCTAPCEDVCRRREFDAPIAIRDLKRFATEYGGHSVPYHRHVVKPRQRYQQRIAIVGAGPTGLSAAYYLARRGYPVTVIDAMPVAGGMMAIGIPDYRLPRAELNRDLDAIRALGVEIKLNTAIGRDVTLDELQHEYDAVLLAVGAQRSQRLGIPGELEYRDVIPATTFLKQFNLDSTETHLEGVVAVIGGGSTAMDAARSALRTGASEVHILYRRTRAEMPAQAEEVRAAIEEGIHLHELVAPVEVMGGAGHVTTLRVQRMVLAEPDANGRRRPMPSLERAYDLPVNRVLVAIGEAPDPSFLPPGTSVEVAAWGGLLVNAQTLATGASGIFAAGDVTYGPKTVIHAAAHGRLAARSIHAYLQGLDPRDVTEMPDDDLQTESSLPPDGVVTLDLRPTPREVMPLRTAAQVRERTTKGHAVEFALGLREAQARQEASRCLRCDLAYLCPTVKVVGTPHSVGAQDKVPVEAGR